MSKKAYFLIYIGSVVFFAAISLLQKTPGYMDAAYYYSSGIQIASGKGFIEPFIWNYLSNPTALPAPAFTYWMPLAGLLSALGMFLFNSTAYWAARLPFIFMAGFIPLLTILISKQFTENKYLYSLAGLFALAGGYYLPYFSVSETFVPFIVLGGFFFLLAGRLFQSNIPIRQRILITALLGIFAGLMHLARADGILWLAGCWLLSVFLPGENGKQKILFCLISTLGYLAVMSPWYIRNILLYHSLFPQGTNLAFFFTNYNDLFAYPFTQLNISHLLTHGIKDFLSVRANAVFVNFQDLLGASGGIILFPFMITGLWLERKNKLIPFSLIMLGTIFIVMSLVFPYAGQRGGFFHSVGALQCFLWAITPIGVERLICKLANLRKWKVDRAIKLLGTTLLGVFILLSFGVFISKLKGNGSELQPGWDRKYQEFIQLDTYLRQNGAKPDDVVMVNDSPGYYAMTGRSAIQMTSGSLRDASAAIEQFNVHYLLIDLGHTSTFDQLYLFPHSINHFTLLGNYNGFVIYRTDG